MPADPSRLIVLAYDHDTKTAAILDGVPSDMLERGNIVARVPMEWRTNHALLDE